jgi:glutamine amidotransferase
VVSDGQNVVAIRYISSRKSEAASLFFSSGTSFDEYGEGMYRMTKADKRQQIIMIASEPLTFERSDWMEVKTNTMLVITPNVRLNVALERRGMLMTR